MLLENNSRYHQLKLAFDLLDECNGSKLLDIGCGDGMLEQYFQKRQTIGIDISKSGLYAAKINAPHSNFVLSDARFLPFLDSSIEIVALIAVLGGIPKGDEKKVFSEINRVLKDRGHMVVLVSQDSQPYSFLVPGRLFKGWEWVHFNSQLLQKQIAESGFTIKKTIFTGGLLSLCLSEVDFVWKTFWTLINRILNRSNPTPELFFKWLNRMIGCEYRPFSSRITKMARFIYLVAEKE